MRKDSWKLYEDREFSIMIWVGKLIGRYYDDSGHPTEYSRLFETKSQEALVSKAAEYDFKEKYPPCNVEWTAEKGSRVWCSSRRFVDDDSW